MSKEAWNNKWAEIEERFAKSKEGQEKTPEREYEINEELLTNNPEEIVAGLEIEEELIPSVIKQIKEAQEDYQERIKSVDESIGLNIKAMYTKTIKAIIDLALDFKK